MKTISFLNPPPLFVEIGQTFLKAVRENDSIELPLERQPDGRLTAKSKETAVTALKKLLDAKNWQPRAKALCAIHSRGVSLRRLSLPGGTREEFQQRLLLQIEAEFPLSPDELAWGWQPLGETKANGALGKQDVLVAAVKKEVIADYRDLLHECGAEPVFTLAAVMRRQLCPERAVNFAMLDIVGGQAELTIFDKDAPMATRVISTDWTSAIEQAVGPTKLFLTGDEIPESQFAAFGGRCERLAARGSAAIAGLQKLADAGEPPLVLRLEQASSTRASFADFDWKKWGARVGGLLAAVLLLPYAEAILLKPHLEKKVVAFKNESARLKVIDRELDFLRELKQSQPPYLETLSVLSKAVPPGTHIDSLSLNSHGEVSLRCAFRDGQQVADFRTKLVASGFFTNAVVEEQTPTPDRQRVNVRMTAQQKALPQLQALATSLPTEETNKEAKAAAPGTMPAATLPPGGSQPAKPPVAGKDGK